MIDVWTNDIHEGDCIDVLDAMSESSVHMAMCSPPYYGLRDYGVDGQIGLEESLDGYIQSLVDVGEALKRVLRDDGSWWLNLGDTYSGGGGMAGVPDDWESPSTQNKDKFPDEPPAKNTSLGRKNKMLVPHRVAIALQDTGWVVRNDVTWVKPNPMPSSVTDRLNTTTEQIFHLTPNPDYWYDLDAIREPHTTRSLERMTEGPVNADTDGRGTNDDFNPDELCHPAGKNPGDVFDVTTKPFPEAHFAVYPPELCETPIKATCPPTVCAECGAGYERDVYKEPIDDAGRSGGSQYLTHGTREDRDAHRQLGGNYQEKLEQRGVEFRGWLKPCDCDTDETESGIVLDPFAGAGTTCLVAKRLGRRFIGIELNAEYVAMAQKRVGVTVDNPEHLVDDEQHVLGAFDG